MEENITYKDQIRQLLTSVDSANVLLALYLIEGVPDLKEELLVLEELDLSNQQLTNLPVMLFECHGLKELNLSKNQLTELAPEIKQLKKLKKLDLSHNQLKKLPNEIAYLRLTHFDVRHNFLEEIPRELRTIFSNNMNSADIFLAANPMFEIENIKQSSYLQKVLIQLFAVYTSHLDLSIPLILRRRIFWAIYFKMLWVTSILLVVLSLVVLFIVRIFTNNFWAWLSSGILFGLVTVKK